MDDKEILRRVIQGFELIPAKQGFGHPYVTKTGAATPELAKRITTWINQNFPQSHIIASYEGAYKTINFRRVMAEHIIFERLIRQILEAEFTNLGITSFRGRPNRVDTFVNKLNKVGDVDPKFTLKNGEEVFLKDARIKKSDGKEYTFSKDSSKFKEQLGKLEPGDKLFLTGDGNKEYKLSDLAKTKELGGLGKGVQRGEESEKRQAATINNALKSGPIDLTVVDVEGKEHILKGVSEFTPVKKGQKADFKFVTANGDVFVQTKDESHQQLEGVVRSNFAKDQEGQALIRELAQKTKQAIQSGRLTKPVIVGIPEGRLQTLAIYGASDETVPAVSSAITMYLIGDVKIENNKLTANKIYYYPYVPKNDPPVLAATYRGGRYQRMPGEKERLADVRLGVYFRSSLSSK